MSAWLRITRTSSSSWVMRKSTIVVSSEQLQFDLCALVPLTPRVRSLLCSASLSISMYLSISLNQFYLDTRNWKVVRPGGEKMEGNWAVFWRGASKAAKAPFNYNLSHQDLGCRGLNPLQARWGLRGMYPPNPFAQIILNSRSSLFQWGVEK
jgi:hypothetical protein